MQLLREAPQVLHLKDLRGTLTRLDATLTKKRGEGSVYISSFGSIPNNAVRCRTSHHANAREHSVGIKRVAPCLFQDGRLIFSELFIDLHHLRDGRLFAWAPKHV